MTDTTTTDAVRPAGDAQTTKTLAEDVAIVTGSSRGIGRTIAERLATEEASVLINYVTNDRAATDVVDAIFSTVLSNSLEDLEENWLVNRAIVNEKPFRVEYSLTEQGSSLEPVITAMDAWGEDYLQETSSRE